MDMNDIGLLMCFMVLFGIPLFFALIVGLKALFHKDKSGCSNCKCEKQG